LGRGPANVRVGRLPTDMVRLDLYYIENWSLWLDVAIILKTVHAVLRHEGAY
jgi:lipopolysaccharide/colanic/teichoic acid biosynthesis glycosyltransferase